MLGHGSAINTPPGMQQSDTKDKTPNQYFKHLYAERLYILSATTWPQSALKGLRRWPWYNSKAIEGRDFFLNSNCISFAAMHSKKEGARICCLIAYVTHPLVYFPIPTGMHLVYGAKVVEVWQAAKVAEVWQAAKETDIASLLTQWAGTNKPIKYKRGCRRKPLIDLTWIPLST